MLEISNTVTYGWEAAIRGMRAKGYRKTKTGKYECFVSFNQKTVMLGTVETEEQAIQKVFDYRKARLMSSAEKYGLNLENSKVYGEKYLVFNDGTILNLHGHRMVGVVDRNGYIHGLLNNVNTQHHRVVAELFCEKFDGKDIVNHKDGNKQNNNADNLEWVTRSENTLHSYRTGLQKFTGNRYGRYEVKKYAND